MADGSTMTDGGVLRDQYADSGRLSARQSLWALRTGPALYPTVLDLAELGGTEIVVDVGCGNRAYLAELRRSGHRGPVLGLDLSEGMARRSRGHAPTAMADAQALPLAAGRVDVVLSMHMLYHVPDVALAVSELRRVLRPGGTAMVATNGPGHAAEAKQILAAAADQVAGIAVDLHWDNRRFTPAEAREVLAAAFDHVEMHDLGDSFLVHDPAVVADYIATWPPESIGLRAGPVWTAVLAATRRLVAAHFAAHEQFRVTSHPVVLRCR